MTWELFQYSYLHVNSKTVLITIQLINIRKNNIQKYTLNKSKYPVLAYPVLAVCDEYLMICIAQIDNKVELIIKLGFNKSN